MADYGFRLTRDECGDHSKTKALDCSWKRDEMRNLMSKSVKAEIDELRGKGIEAVAAVDVSGDVIEVRRKAGGELISWYEVEEFEHR